MTAGAYLPAGEEFNIPTLTTSFTAEHPVYHSRGLFDPVAQVAGAVSRVVVDIRSLPVGGTPQNIWAFFDDYYNRVYFIPTSVEFGAVGSDSSKVFRVWNAYAQNVTINNVTISGDAGLSLPSFVTPYVMKPLELKEITINAESGGLPKITSELLFDMSVGNDLVLPVNGERSKVWELSPNWASGLQITYEYLTEIHVARSRREQRVALRQTPRKRAQFSIVAAFADLLRLQHRFAAWNGRTWQVPEYSRRAVLSTGLAPNATSCNVVAAPDWLAAGLNVLLVSSQGIEARTVDHVVGNTVTFTGSSSENVPAGAALHPSLSALMASTTAASYITDAAATMPVQFDVLPGSENLEDDGTPFEIFNGRELFLKRHNWGESVDIDFGHFTEKVDFNRGPIAQFAPAKFNSRDLKVVFMNKDNSEAEELLKFFRRMRGQRGEFYRPTFTEDFKLKLNSPSGTVFMRFDGLELMQYADDPIWKAVFVKLPNGDHVCNTIKAITQISDIHGTDTQFEFDSPWPVAITQAAEIHWLPVWRMASDSAVFTWHTDTVCSVQMTLRTCEALSPEV